MLPTSTSASTNPDTGCTNNSGNNNHIGTRKSSNSNSNSNSIISRRKQKKQRKRQPIKNQLLQTKDNIKMALLLSSLLTILILMLNQQPSFSFSSSKSDQYLYANPDEPSESESNKKVWPIIDYVTPDKGKLESDKSFKKRIENPVFLTDQYEKPRMVEFYAPWCGVSFNSI
jgi:hypothetical protein